MIGAIKRKVKLTVLRAIDNYGCHRTNRHKKRSNPSIWDLAINQAGHLAIGKIDLLEVAKNYGTPLHIVHLDRLKSNYTFFLNSFSRHYPRVDIGYSYKTNPVPTVIKKLHDFGASAEVISHFELWLALRLGVAPENIIFNGPGKTTESLRLAVEKGVRIINIDGLDEIPELSILARKYDKVQPVGIRLVASVGWSGQFGLSIVSGAAWEAVDQIRKEPNLSLIGLHIHLGTGIKEVGVYLQAIEEVLNFSVKIQQDVGIKLKYLDFGGGFGTPTVSPYTPLDRHLIEAGYPPFPPDYSAASPLAEYAMRIVEKVGQFYSPEDPSAPTLVFEPGRAITGSAQLLLLKVLTTKPGKGGVLNVILDGGRNLIMPPNWEQHAVLPASKMSEVGTGYCNLYGPLCHPGDLLFRSRWLPDMEKGDYLAVMDSGAYFIPNQMNFSNPRSAVAIVQDDQVQLIRKRESFEDIVAMDQI